MGTIIQAVKPQKNYLPHMTCTVKKITDQARNTWGHNLLRGSQGPNLGQLQATAASNCLQQVRGSFGPTGQIGSPQMCPPLVYINDLQTTGCCVWKSLPCCARHCLAFRQSSKKLLRSFCPHHPNKSGPHFQNDQMSYFSRTCPF